MMRQTGRMLLVLLTLTGIYAVFGAACAHAQYGGPYGGGIGGGYGGYNMPGSAISSPYFQFFRRDRGPFGQYLSFVRPQQNLQNVLRTQRGQLNLLQGEIRRVGEQERIDQTGANSVYMNYGNYFQNQGVFYSTRGVAPGGVGQGNLGLGFGPGR